MAVQLPTPFPIADHLSEQVFFDRKELALILSVYGRGVAAGEWRDYTIHASQDKAVFSICRRTAEYPLYRIEKCPLLRHRQGIYAIIGSDKQILRRGHDLAVALRALEKLRSVSS